MNKRTASDKTAEWSRISPADLLTMKDQQTIHRQALLIALLYAGLGFLWIFLTDALTLHWGLDPENMARISLIKGAGFVLVTGMALYGMLTRSMLNARKQGAELQFINRIQDKILKEKTDELQAANVQMGEQMKAHRLAKEQLARFNEDLEEEVRQRTDLLNRTIGELELKVDQHSDMEEALKQSEEQYRLAVSEAPIPLVIHKEDGTIVSISRAWYDMTGYSPEGITNVVQLIRKMDGDRTDGLLFHNSRSYRPGNRQYDGSVKVQTMDETQRTWDLYSSHVGQTKDGQAMAMTVGIDVTERIRREEEVNYLSYHDALTGLYNRRFFEQKLRQLDDEHSYPLSIIVGDVNGLKLTNDVFGHFEGDRLLQQVSRILLEASGPDDVVARWGGDEFIVLLPNCSAQRAREICRAIRVACSREQESRLALSISLGADTKTVGGQDISAVLQAAETRMYEEKLKESTQIRRTILQSIREKLREKTADGQEQAERIGELTRQIGLAMGLSEIKLNEIDLLATLHDMGEIAIETDILEKKERLDEEEWMEIRRHPEIGYRIAQSAPELGVIAEYILTHHEHWDGTGYPQGLSGRDIPLLARILAVVDAYNAMTSDRPYRQAMSVEEAREELLRGSGTQFDPDIVRIFLEKVL